MEYQMEWMQVLAIAGSVVGAMWFMHRQTFTEMRDFHGRLCILEEKYRQMMERYLEERNKK
jgi:hypothetical protein